MNTDYYTKRQQKFDLRYRLNRRAKEIINAIKLFKGKKINRLLDVGTCDGAMIKIFNKELDINTCVGTDLADTGIKDNKEFEFIQCDCQKIPLESNDFDILTAAAVIEHVSNPTKVIIEFNRVLKKGGICIITTPNPFFDNIATKIGYLKEEYHNELFNLDGLKTLLEENNFKVRLAKRFMISPFGFPKEEKIEKILNKLKLDKLMCNQLIVGEKI